MDKRNVYIFKPDNLGDLVLFSGTLKHFRSLYPKANITLFVKQQLKNLFEHCPHTDHLKEWESLSSVPLDWLPGFRGKYRFNWLIRRCMNIRKKADTLLLPVRSPKSGIFGMQKIVSTIKANEKFGIAGDFSNQSKIEDNISDKYYTKRLRLTPAQETAHELDINCEFLRYLGIKLKKIDIWPEFWTTDKDRAWAQALIPSNEGSIRVAVCPGVTSSRGKFYSGLNYAKAISELKGVNFQIILFGDTASKNMCEEVGQEISNCNNVKTLINLSGESTIRQMIEGLKRCNIVISQETGALHAAVALGKPTIGIIGGGHYGRFYPWGNKNINRVVNRKMDCYGCNWSCIYPTARCIQEITYKKFAEQLKLVLEYSGLMKNKKILNLRN